MQDQLTGRDKRILLSESQPLILRRRFFAALGAPGERSPEWCRASIEVLVDAEYWAPEIHWTAGEPLDLHLASAANARWAFEAAARAGYEAQLNGTDLVAPERRVLVHRAHARPHAG